MHRRDGCSLQPVVREFCSVHTGSRELTMRGTHERLDAVWCPPPQEAQSRDRGARGRDGRGASGGDAQGGPSARLAQGHSSPRSPSWGLRGSQVPDTGGALRVTDPAIQSQDSTPAGVGRRGTGVVPGPSTGLTPFLSPDPLPTRYPGPHTPSDLARLPPPAPGTLRPSTLGTSSLQTRPSLVAGHWQYLAGRRTRGWCPPWGGRCPRSGRERGCRARRAARSGGRCGWPGTGSGRSRPR